MNKIERQMTYEIYELCNQVPNIRNNMSNGDLARFRFDSMEQTGFVKELLYSLMMYSQGDESFRDKFAEDIAEFRDFVAHRGEEEWTYNTNCRYRFGQSAW